MFSIQVIRGGRNQFSSNQVSLTYSSIGDTNGAVYFIGTNYLQGGFTNPNTSGRVVCTMSTVEAGSATDLVDRAYNDTYTHNAVGSFMAIDLGANRSLSLTAYTLRGATSTGNYLRTWKIQGSNDAASNSVSDLTAATWTDLDTQTSNATINGGSQAVAVSSVSGGGGSYRWLRLLLSTGGDSAGANYCICSDFEFYGVLTYI